MRCLSWAAENYCEIAASLLSRRTDSEAESEFLNTCALGLISLRDEIRPATKHVIDFLKQRGMSVTLLTGDRLAVAENVAAQVGIEDLYAELSPQAKLQCIHDWRAAGKKVAMVGDGINDARAESPAADTSQSGWAPAAPTPHSNRRTSFSCTTRSRMSNRHSDWASGRGGSFAKTFAISLGVISVLIVSALAERINLTAGSRSPLRGLVDRHEPPRALQTPVPKHHRLAKLYRARRRSPRESEHVFLALALHPKARTKTGVHEEERVRFVCIRASDAQPGQVLR